MKKWLFLIPVFLLLMSTSVFAVRLPVDGGDNNLWGSILNNYLNQSLGDNATDLNVTNATISSWLNVSSWGWFGGVLYEQGILLSNRYVNKSDWTSIDNYPTVCSSGYYISEIADTLTCINLNNSHWLSWNNLTDVPAGFADGVDNDTNTHNTTEEMVDAVMSQADNTINYTDGSDTWGSNMTFMNDTMDVRDDDTTYTAGDALTLTGTDFDFDGGTTPGGELGGTWASPTVDSGIHDDEYIELGDTFGGDVSGTYGAIQVDDISSCAAQFVLRGSAFGCFQIVGTEWIGPSEIADVDADDVENDENTFVDIGGDAMTGALSVKAAVGDDTGLVVINSTGINDRTLILSQGTYEMYVDSIAGYYGWIGPKIFFGNAGATHYFAFDTAGQTLIEGSNGIELMDDVDVDETLEVTGNFDVNDKFNVTASTGALETDSNITLQTDMYVKWDSGGYIYDNGTALIIGR